MVASAQDIDVIEAALSALSRLSPKDLNDASDVNTATACLFRIKMRHGVVESVKKHRDASTEDVENHGPAPFRFASLPISEVAVEVLRESGANEAMSLVDIVKAAQDGGYRFDGANPNQSARSAFDRRAKNKGDLIQVSKTHWGLRE